MSPQDTQRRIVREPAFDSPRGPLSVLRAVFDPGTVMEGVFGSGFAGADSARKAPRR